MSSFSSSQDVPLLDETLNTTHPMTEIDRCIHLWQTSPIAHNVHNYVQTIDNALAVCYKRLNRPYYDEHHVGKFYRYCQQHGIDTDTELVRNLQSSSTHSPLLKFDSIFPLNAHQPQLAESDHHLHCSDSQHDEWRNMLWSFCYHGAMFVDCLLKPSCYSLSDSAYKQILFHGYSRCGSYNLFVPSDIIRLIYAFWDSEYLISFSGNKLSSMLSSRCGEKWHEKVVINGIPTSIILYPNGSKLRYLGKMLVYVQTELPANIEAVGLHLEYICPQLSVRYKTTRIYSDHRNRRHGIDMMKLSDCALLPRLDFIFNIDITFIKYKDTKFIHSFHPYTMGVASACRWDLPVSTLESALTSKVKQYLHGPIFDNYCWGLMARVWSASTRINNRFRPSIKLYGLPRNIVKVKVHILMNIQPNNLFYCDQVDVITFKPFLMETRQTLESVISALNQCQSSMLSVYCSLKILCAWTYNDELIPMDQLDPEWILLKTCTH